MKIQILSYLNIKLNEGKQADLEIQVINQFPSQVKHLNLHLG